ncbi:hypothetical protein Q1695_003075 [Nippostrongylus brasiliensis]|nr:hypothetical protein Q1695_003075 [Nippostrongylus brasiliensis]
MPPAAKGKFGPETKVYVSFGGSGEANKTLIGAFSPSGDFLFRSCLTTVKSLQIEVTEDLHEDVVVDHFIIDTGFRNCQSATNKREVDVLLPLSIESVSKWP